MTGAGSARSPRLLLVKAGLLVAAVRLGLWLVRFSRLQVFLAKLAGLGARPGEEEMSAASIAHVVEAMSLHVPRATCLTKALAIQVLLAQHGKLSTVRIGVAKDAARNLRAHAWVEVDGAVVGARPEDLARFIELYSLSVDERRENQNHGKDS